MIDRSLSKALFCLPYLLAGFSTYLCLQIVNLRTNSANVVLLPISLAINAPCWPKRGGKGDQVVSYEPPQKKMLTRRDAVSHGQGSRFDPSLGNEVGCGSRSTRWYVVQTLQQCEGQAAYELDRQNYQVFFPRIIEQRPKGDRIAPLFPGYGFVSFSLRDDRWRPICSTRGVRRLFGASPEMPTPVPHGVVEAIRDRCRSGDGLIDERQALPDLDGKAVRVLAGPFQGFEGICSLSGDKRIEVMLSMFGREQPVGLNREDVRVVG